jgi:hypothetical protein
MQPLYKFCRNLRDPVEHIPLSCRGMYTSYFFLNGYRTSGVESTVVAFSDTFLLEKANFCTIFSMKKTPKNVPSTVEYTCTADLSHSFKFSCKLQFKCISAYILHYIASRQLQLQLYLPWRLPPQRSYQNTLVSLVSFLDGQKYHKNTVFAEDQLAAITADDILRWMNLKAFGTPFPGPDANLTGCRSSTILFWKKSLSFFMPNKHHPRDSLVCRGNPTQSREVLDLVKYIKKKEV